MAQQFQVAVAHLIDDLTVLKLNTLDVNDVLYPCLVLKDSFKSKKKVGYFSKNNSCTNTKVGLKPLAVIAIAVISLG